MPTVVLTWSADGTLCRYKVVPDAKSVPYVDCDYSRVVLPSGALRQLPAPPALDLSTPDQMTLDMAEGVDPDAVWRWRRDQLRRLERRRVESVRRLRRAIRLTGSSLVMITLTVGGRRCYSRSDILDLFAGFVRVLRGHEYFRGVRLLAVPEPHLGGDGDAVNVPWHIHCVYPSRSRMPYAVLLWLRSAWTEYLVSCGYPVSEGARYHRVHVTAPRRLAGVIKYLAGYLSKSMVFDGYQLESPTAPAGRVHRYYVTRNSLERIRLTFEEFLMLRAGSSYSWDYWRSPTAELEEDLQGLCAGWLYFEGFS